MFSYCRLFWRGNITLYNFNFISIAQFKFNSSRNLLNIPAYLLFRCILWMTMPNPPFEFSRLPLEVILHDFLWLHIDLLSPIVNPSVLSLINCRSLSSDDNVLAMCDTTFNVPKCSLCVWKFWYISFLSSTIHGTDQIMPGE